MKSAFAGILVLGLGAMAMGAETLDIYVIDTEGGKAVIVQSPGGAVNMLIDGGYPGNNNRDTNRIVAMATSLGITQFDYVLATHYDTDHSGNIGNVVAKIPGKAFIDHGDPVPTQNANSRKNNYDPYIAAVGNSPRISVKPGVTIAFHGLKITVVSAGGSTITSPLPDANQPNPLYATSVQSTYKDTEDNLGSVGLLYEFGSFRMLDLADLLASVEWNLVCPNNLIGTVDLFMVSHHGYTYSNSEVLVHAICPSVAIMNNGPNKGGDLAVFNILRTSPGFVDLWQLHYSSSAGSQNSTDDFIANPKNSSSDGNAIKVSVQTNGKFTVTNLRNAFSKTYEPQAAAADSDGSVLPR